MSYGIYFTRGDDKLMEQRTRNGTETNRRHWTVRYSWLLGFLCLFTASAVGAWYDNKHVSANAMEKAKENEDRWKKYADEITSIPGVKKQIDQHIIDFREYKVENRQRQQGMDNKLDRILGKL